MAKDQTKVEALFEAARSRPVEQRDQYLADACGRDTELRETVESLLASHDAAGEFLQRPAMGAAADPHHVLITPGTVIGRYKLLEPIGEGGYGTVFMAEQTSPVHRKVALKIIKAGMDSKQVIARFEAERQALALMDHPNIAKVHDAGVTDAGRPYFVMELVKGTPITKYCDEHRLTPRQRLELFVQVCQAVQHAHQKGIIHRDLKPTNVLVAQYDGNPVPKIIDFGVAKATGQQLTERTMFTGFGDVIGTPQYMSPEQAELNQLDVDTRSDIYSLGVLLYELLTGTTPLEAKRVKEAALLEVLRVVREEEPPKPSTRLSTIADLPSIAAQRGLEPKKLSGLVQGELDWIVMKALEKDRARRYDTANGFASDIHRYLADEPVLACPPSAAYRLKKFTRRNKATLVTASVIAIALLLAVATLGWSVRDRTARHAKVAGQVELILTEVEQLEREQKWPDALAAARRADAVVVGGEADAATAQRVRESLKDLEFLDHLEQIRMQRATWVDGKFDDAAADREYARAFHDYGVDMDALPVAASIDRLKARPALAIPLAAALDDWVSARSNVSERDATRWKPLVAVARGIDPEPLRDRLRSTWGQSSSEAEDELRRLAESIDVQAQHPATLLSLARTLLRVKQSDSALRLLRDAQVAYPADFWLNYDLGHRLAEQKDYDGAIRFYTAAVSIRPHAVAALNNLGNALRDQKKLDEAIAAYRKAIEIDPTFAFAYYGLGHVLHDQKKLDEAIAACRKAIELDPKDAYAYNGLGNVLRDQKKLDEAIAAYRKAIELDPKYAIAHNNLGIALRDQKKLEEAIAACRKAIELDPTYANAYINLGAALHDQKKLDEAIAACRKAIELDPKVAAVHNNLGSALCDQKKLDEAIAAYRKAIEIDPTFSYAYSNLGVALYHQKKLDEAVAALRKAIELDPKYADAYHNLGGALNDQGKLEEAIAASRRAIELDPKNARAYYNLGWALSRQGDNPGAIAAYQKAIALDPEYAGGHNELAWLLTTCPEAEFRDPAQAVALAKKAIELDPENSNYHNTLGAACYRSGDWKGAVAALEKSMELRQGVDISDWFFLAMAHWQLGHKEEARRWYDKGVQWMDAHNANSETMVRFRREAAELLGVNDKAERAALEAARQLNQRAWALATNADPAQRDPEQAVALAEKAVAELPKDPDCWNTLGVAHYRAGDFEEAVSALQKYRDLRTSDAEYSNPFFLAMAHWQLGHREEARQWYDRGVDWMEKEPSRSSETMKQFRREAAELLGVNDQQVQSPSSRPSRETTRPTTAVSSPDARASPP